jgi:LytS/YehU family sensor histidine kinase
VHLVAAAVMVDGLAVLNVTIGRALYPDLAQSWTVWFLGYMSRAGAWNLLVYGGLVGLAHAIDARARLRHREIESARLETQLTRAQLHSLQLQLQPHFLFNTLHAIGVLNQEAPDRATRMIASLGDLLRASLDTRATQEIPLDRELELLAHYLEIESIRFSDRLTIAVDVAPGLNHYLVPTFLLQPLVENAVRHGVAVRTVPSRIRVVAEPAGDELVLSVWNDGPPIDAGRLQEGVGLATTRDRLQRLYGDAGGLTLRNHDGGVECVARLPLHDQPVL